MDTGRLTPDDVARYRERGYHYPVRVMSAADAAGYADPLPQALVLTAIVISFGMTAFVIVLALKARVELGNDHVDGKEVR